MKETMNGILSIAPFLEKESTGGRRVKNSKGINPTIKLYKANTVHIRTLVIICTINVPVFIITMTYSIFKIHGFTIEFSIFMSRKEYNVIQILFWQKKKNRLDEWTKALKIWRKKHWTKNLPYTSFKTWLALSVDHNREFKIFSEPLSCFCFMSREPLQGTHNKWIFS